jgi:hypothetical protein
MNTNVKRRAAVAGASVLTLVAIGSGAFAWSGGSAGAPATATEVAGSVEATGEGAVPEGPRGAQLCAAGEVPSLTVEQFPDERTPGAATIVEAIQRIVPSVKSVGDLVQTPLGPASLGAPVWVDVAGATYLVEQAPAGGWHASAASQDGCDDLSSFTRLD